SGRTVLRMRPVSRVPIPPCEPIRVAAQPLGIERPEQRREQLGKLTRAVRMQTRRTLAVLDDGLLLVERQRDGHGARLRGRGWLCPSDLGAVHDDGAGGEVTEPLKLVAQQ